MENLVTTTTQPLNPVLYSRLLADTLPTVIKTEAENERLLAQVERLMAKGEALSPEEGALLELLGQLIADFEELYYPIGDPAPHLILQELMQANDMEQKDLVPLFGSRSRVSEAVNGKRSFSKAQAKALSERFGVPADLFL